MSWIAGTRVPANSFATPFLWSAHKETGARLRLEAERRFAAEVSFISRQCRERSEANARSAMWTVIHPSRWEPFDNGKFGENRLLATFRTKASFLWSLRGFFLTRQKEISQKGFAGASPLHSAPRRVAPRSASRRSPTARSAVGGFHKKYARFSEIFPKKLLTIRACFDILLWPAVGQVCVEAGDCGFHR